jgi:hypothetical protein
VKTLVLLDLATATLCAVTLLGASSGAQVSGVYKLPGVLVWLHSRVVFSPFGVFGVTSVVSLS